MTALKDKWNTFYHGKALDTCKPCNVLHENAFLLPSAGRALDLACGLGANAVFMAKQGLDVSAWDISEVALEQLQAVADLRNLSITTQIIEITCASSMPEECFDIIVVSRFLDRALTNAIIAMLKNGGLLFYQTYTQIKATSSGPNNPDYLLAPQELLQLFAPLKPVFYRENALVGNVQKGLRNEAQFIGQKIYLP